MKVILEMNELQRMLLISALDNIMIQQRLEVMQYQKSGEDAIMINECNRIYNNAEKLFEQLSTLEFTNEDVL